MTTATLYLKRGDTLPAFRAIVRDSTGEAVDLTAATSARLILRGNGYTRIKILDILEPKTDGRIRYEWTAGDWTGEESLLAGSHRLEVELTFTGGAVLTVPTRGHLRMDITEDLA